MRQNMEKMLKRRFGVELYCELIAGDGDPE